MKHPRTLIREAVKERLVAQLPAIDPRITAARISIHRSTPLFAGKLPAILIYKDIMCMKAIGCLLRYRLWTINIVM